MLKQLTIQKSTTHLTTRHNNHKDHFNKELAREKESIETPYVKEETRTQTHQPRLEDAVPLPIELQAQEHVHQAHLEMAPTHTDK